MTIRILLLLFISTVSIAKSETIDQNKFFKTYEDYKSNKAIVGLTVVKIELNKVIIDKNGTSEKVKFAELPSPFFTNNAGILMRVFDGDLYFVVVDGPLCFYVKHTDAKVTYSKDGTFYFFSFNGYAATNYYSETISGEIVKLKKSTFDDYLKKYGLEAQYESDKISREFKDDADDYDTKVKNKYVKYFKLINEKMK